MMQPAITSKRMQILIGILSLLIVLCFTFLLGVKVGERRARHLNNWSEYAQGRGLMMPQQRGGRPMRLPFRPMPFPNGVFGRVLSASGTTLLIEGQDHFQQNVVITTSTAIRTEQGSTSSSAIQPNQEVGVFGSPNGQGQIEANLIRLFPEHR
jgi:hypothetical protein